MTRKAVRQSKVSIKKAENGAKSKGPKEPPAADKLMANPLRL